MKKLVAAWTIAAGVTLLPWGALGDPPRTASFQFKDMPGVEALRAVATQFGYGVVAGEGVCGSLTADLSDVTLEQALQHVAQATGCEYVVRDGVILINPPPSDSGGTPLETASFNFKGARGADALRLVATQFGYSVVMGESVGGTLTANLNKVTLEEALQYVAQATGCEYVVRDHVILVNPSAPVSRVFPLRYLGPDAAATAITKMLSEQGSVEPFTGRGEKAATPGSSMMNALIVTDTPARVDRIASVLRGIDVRPRQVTIEAKLVESVLGKDERLGFDWQLRASAVGAKIPTTFPFPKDNAGSIFTGSSNPNDQVGGGGPSFPPGETFPYAAPGDFKFGKLSFEEFSVAMEILKQQSNTNLVSSPQVTTLDNQEAEIIVGKVVPVATYEHLPLAGTLQITGYTEQKIGVRLVVTPRFTSDSTLVLTVSPEVSEIVEYRGQFNERPVTSTRSATTQVIIKNGETILIGGLISTLERKVERKVPVLGDIPLLGYLFRHKSDSKEKVDLMIFVTPRIAAL
jgi:type II secretory pathway component GspD/PulD (secretin)